MRRALLGLILLSSLPVWADVVTLKGDRIMRGTVIREDALSVVLKTGSGACLTIPRSEIVSIAKGRPVSASPPLDAAFPPPPGKDRAAGGSSPRIEPSTSLDPRVAALAEALEDPDPVVRRNGANVLGNTAYLERREQDWAPAAWASGAVPLLRKALMEDPDEDVRYYAGVAIGQIGPSAKDAIGDLIGLVERATDKTASAAMRALGGIGPDAKSGVQALLVRLGEPGSSDSFAAADGLGGIGPSAAEAVPDLIAHLEHWLRNPEGGGAATFARALGGIGAAAEDAVPLLLPHAIAAEGNLRTGILEGLAGIGGSGMPAVLKALQYRGPALGPANNQDAMSVRWDAAIALGKSRTRDPEAIQAVLRTMLDDEESVLVRREAVWTLLHAGASAELGKVRDHLYERSKKEGLSVEETRVLREINVRSR